MPRHPTIAVVSAVLLFATGVATAVADGPPTTTVTSTTQPTTTAAAATTTVAEPTATTVPATTTAAATTTPTVEEATTAPTTSAARTTTRTPVAATPAHALSFAHGCPVAGVALLLPGRAPESVGAIAHPHHDAALQDLAYPAGGSVVTASAATLAERGCANGSPERAHAQVRAVSLLGGELTAAAVTLSTGAVAIARLVVGGRHVPVSPGTRIPLRPWGYAVASWSGGRAVAALAVHLLRARAGLPAGTTILIAAASASPPRVAAPAHAARRPKKRHPAGHEPLKATPRLGGRRYVFPVVGAAGYGDTYGAFRGDVPGNWHHGDDIFAPLGTPVVAVADGTINRVGWERLGGWRLWVRDAVGDEFYYAHLSGYAPADLRSSRVTAGEVIGFIGNSGDAFTTAPHLHFEIHPRPLLHLAYDGAVDPTTYLNAWTHLRHVAAPRPAHPPLPRQPALRKEARYIFRELLAARHLIRRPPGTHRGRGVPAHAGQVHAGPMHVGPMRAVAAPAARVGSPSAAVASLAALAGLALLAGTSLWIWRRRP